MADYPRPKTDHPGHLAIKDDRDLLEREGKRFKELSKRWDFSVVTNEYDEMFDGMLSG